MPSKKTFLIVDDSYIDRLVSGLLVKRTIENTDVVEVSGGSQAIEWLKGNTKDVSNDTVILLDIMMPQMNGFEFLDAFETMADKLANQPTIIMLSSTLDFDDIERAKQHPRVSQLLSKPLSANELKKAVGV